jgi:prevent-host-death family protein
MSYRENGINAIIIYLNTLPLAEARAQLSKLVEEASATHERIEITKNGHRAAVLLGPTTTTRCWPRSRSCLTLHCCQNIRAVSMSWRQGSR